MKTCERCGFERNRLNKCLKCGNELYMNGSFEEYLVDDLLSIIFNNTTIRIFPTFLGGDKSFGHWLNDVDINGYLYYPPAPETTVGYKIDAILNSANNFLIPGSGLSKYFYEKFGEEYNAKTKNLIKQYKSLKKGSAYFIPFNSKKFRVERGVIHAVVIEYTTNNNKLERKLSTWKDIYNSIYSSLDICDRYKIKSVAIPQMASREGFSIYGKSAYKKMLIATYMAITDYLYENNTMIKEIYIHPTDYLDEEFLINLL